MDWRWSWINNDLGLCIKMRQMWGMKWIPEHHYIQVGSKLGISPMVPFTALHGKLNIHLLNRFCLKWDCPKTKTTFIPNFWQIPDTSTRYDNTPLFTVCNRCFGMLVVFKSRQSLLSMLYDQSERPPDEEEAGQGIVYQIPCSYGKTYIGEHYWGGLKPVAE